MRCKDIKIPTCPSCKMVGINSRECWIWRESDILTFKSPRPTKDFLIKRLRLLNDWDLKYSKNRPEKSVFYFKQALKCRFSDMYDMIERAEILL